VRLRRPLIADGAVHKYEKVFMEKPGRTLDKTSHSLFFLLLLGCAASDCFHSDNAEQASKRASDQRQLMLVACNESMLSEFFFSSVRKRNSQFPQRRVFRFRNPISIRYCEINERLELTSHEFFIRRFSSSPQANYCHERRERGTKSHSDDT
jgi:hypothetical protein